MVQAALGNTLHFLLVFLFMCRMPRFIPMGLILSGSALGCGDVAGFHISGHAFVKTLHLPVAQGGFQGFGHFALYVLMLTVPGIALLRDAARGRDGNAENALTHFGDLWHGRSAWFLLALVVGHIVMTVIHQRRGEKVLQRMAGRQPPAGGDDKG